MLAVAFHRFSGDVVGNLGDFQTLGDHARLLHLLGHRGLQLGALAPVDLRRGGLLGLLLLLWRELGLALGLELWVKLLRLALELGLPLELWLPLELRLALELARELGERGARHR